MCCRREPKRDVCGTILLYEADTEYQTPMFSAQVIFRYPIVGRVIFRQPQDRPWEDTTIIIESMVRILKLSGDGRGRLHRRDPYSFLTHLPVTGLQYL